MQQLLRMAAEIGPLIIFVTILNRMGLQNAIISLLITAPIGCAVNWFIERKVPYMLFVGAILVLGFGAAAIYFENENIFKMKPTIAYLFFAVILGGGLFLGKNLLRHLLGMVLQMEDQGWKLLTIAWTFFFLAMAVLNEFIWRNYSPEFWGNFKLFGFIPITLVFGLAVTPIILKYKKDED
jgi:intracellular septation protein